MRKFVITLLTSVGLIVGCRFSEPAGSPEPDSQVRETSRESEGKEKEEQWPKTVKEAVDRILSSMSEEDKKTVRGTKKEDLIKFHHGWGTGIRNKFGLWAGNRELLNDTNASHPDDASMKIIEAVWERLQKEK